MTESIIALHEFQGVGARGVAIELLKKVTYNMIVRPEQYCVTVDGDASEAPIGTDVGPFGMTALVRTRTPGAWYVPATEEDIMRRVGKRMGHMALFGGVPNSEKMWNSVIEDELAKAAKYADYPDDAHTVVYLGSQKAPYAQHLYILGVLAREKRYAGASVQVNGGTWIPLSRLRDSAGQVAHSVSEGNYVGLAGLSIAHEAQLSWAERLL